MHCSYYTEARLDISIYPTISSEPYAWIQRHSIAKEDRLREGDPNDRPSPERLLISHFPVAEQPETLPSSIRPSIEMSWRMKGHRRQTQPWSEQRTLERGEEGSVVRPTLTRRGLAKHSRHDCGRLGEA